MPSSELHAPILAWYATAARDLPWRRPDVTAWAVLVSEIMLQQTPVARVLPAYAGWLDRWPTPVAMARATAGDAIRAWGRLGYPRRALRLHRAAELIVERHDGELPSRREELLALPGVGEYTAAAVLSFAYGQRHAVLDTNVRRVLARVGAGEATVPPARTALEQRRAESLLPDDDGEAARWAAATMELGALVCTARTPACEGCPVLDLCAWRRNGAPRSTLPPRRAQGYAGTDRQARGMLLAALRTTSGPLAEQVLLRSCPDPAQARRALTGLVLDGLAVEVGPSTPGPRHYALPDQPGPAVVAGLDP